MKRKTKLSASLMIFLLCLMSFLLYISYTYYFNSLNKVQLNKTKVKFDDYLSIDSIKNVAVADTVHFFIEKIKSIEQLNTDLQNRFNQTEVDNSFLKKKNDSMSIRLNTREYYYQQKIKDLKPQDTTKID
jgi:hypothetical protein